MLGQVRPLRKVRRLGLTPTFLSLSLFLPQALKQDVGQGQGFVAFLAPFFVCLRH